MSMEDISELASAEVLQVELENAGYDIFTGAIAAISENLLPAYDGKPLGCFILKFGRIFDYRRTPAQLDEIRGEMLEVSVISPERVRGLKQDGQPGDVFIHPELPKYVKKFIQKEVGRVGRLPLREHFSETISRRAIVTEYSTSSFNGIGKIVDTTEYSADPRMLASGKLFAEEVLEYMNTELYTRRPTHYTELYDEKSEGNITHTLSVIYSARPPINGQETEPWLKGYATWLQNSIQKKTSVQANQAPNQEFIDRAEVAMDDGILLLHALEAIKRRQ